ncbi:carboxypeptidase-like regulatory domain-containing protein [Microlunatus speluncae]|uniref:carboxypeptidase-like regulatory domain-containing protein n=1 Tax=Microlunatus speluncae TaxID=2594267 RepID=UPI001266337E|nr:carboxypeptidase-like regulatory domain-containing protein [Microlunatus speluncae]
MLLGHVSDELYQALHDVAVEITDDTGNHLGTTRSTASGAIHAELEPGAYRLILARDGYGPKRSRVITGQPTMIRMLSDTLYGYVWPKWSAAGDTAELRIHSPEPYRATLWRYGYRREPIELLGWFDEHGPRAMRQVLPDHDLAGAGAGFNGTGFTSPGHVRRLTAPDRSGLYYLRVETPSGRHSSFPWIVAPARPAADIAVLAGTNNWNAYNRFGGRSNYINEAGLPAAPVVSARQDLARYVIGNKISQTAPNDSYPPLSFDRPDLECAVGPDEEVTDPLAGRISGTLAPGFWRLLGWLEREGWPHDVYADHQLHSGVLDLDRYRVLILECHPEYWSREMYDRTKAWVERGGRLAYLGGNGIDCEVVFDEAGSAATYLTQQPDRDDPEQAHLESRFHQSHRPQAELLGVTFTHAGEGTGAPYRVIDPDHWAFAGSGLRRGDLIGRTSLSERIPGGASGHETDKITASAPADVELLAQGTNPDDGGADLIMRELPSGGAVFSAGSMTYIPSLLVDEPLTRLTNTVLRRFVAGPE